MTRTATPRADVDVAVQRRARLRAEAVAIADSRTTQRNFVSLPGISLRAATRRRLHAAQPRQPAPSAAALPRGIRRTAGIVLLIAQIAVLGLLLWLPQFQVTTIQVTGANLLNRQAVLAGADLTAQSIFTVDSSALRQRLLRNPWIRDVAVTVSLPHSVQLAISEWQPVLRLRHGASDTLVADSGATIDSTAGRPDAVAKVPVLLNQRVSSTPLNPQLVQTLDQTSTSFAAVFGCTVAAYQWRADGALLIWTSAGWAAVLGHMDSQAEIAGIPAQLSTLAALRGKLDYQHPTFGYVDLENPGAPATGGSPGLPAEIIAATQAPAPTGITSATSTGAATTPLSQSAASDAPATPSATPTSTAAPTPTATPVPSPTATPYTVYYIPGPPPGH